VAYVLAGDAELLETQRAGLEEPLEISADGFIELRGVRLYALPYAAQELYHADLGCSEGILDSSHRHGTGEATRDGLGRCVGGGAYLDKAQRGSI
jgi:hypothetical protein